MGFSKCPRCEDQSYEQLGTHGYCVSCDYSPALDPRCEEAIPDWAIEVLESARGKSRESKAEMGAA